MGEYVKVPIASLETRRLILRPLMMSDAPRVQQLFDNWNVLKYLYASIPYPYPADGAEEYLKSVLTPDNHDYYWAITLKSDSESSLIGQLSLRPELEHAQRGFWLGEPYWGQGYMKEAVAASHDFAFDVLKMKELLLGNAEENVASHKLKERAGAEIIGRLPFEFQAGTLTAVDWRLTAEAWAKHRDGFLNG